MRALGIPLLFALAGTGCVTYERSLESLAPEARRLFEILDSFDDVDTSRLQFVRFTFGEFSDSEPGDPRPIYRFGFLEKAEGGRFQIRHLHLMRDTYVFSPEGTPAWERVGYEPWNFKDFLQSRATEDFTDAYVYPHAIFERGIEDVILARDCLRHGMVDECLTLIGRPLDAIPQDLGRGLNHLLRLRLRDPAFTREKILEHHRRWLELFPSDDDCEDVERRTAILERMVDEDRRETPGRPGGRPTSESLVEGLRDEFGRVERYQLWTWMLPAMWPPEGKSIPGELIDRGFDSVPALIRAIGDERFTRCAAYNSRFGGSIEPVTIDWMAREILKEISGLADANKEDWTAWFAAVKKRGEEAVLADMVAKGEHSTWAVDRLLEKWPHRVDVLIRSLRELDSDKVSSRDLLIQRLDKHWSPEAAACLRDEIKDRKDTQARIAASEVLWNHGDRTGLEWGLRIWPAETLVTPEEKWSSDSDNRQERRLREELAEFLINTGEVEAFKVLGRSLPARPESIRRAVLDQLTGKNLRKRLETAGERRPELEFALAALVEPYLIEFTEEWSVRWFQYRGRSLSLSNPRNADLAACVTVDCWPDLFRFDPKAPRRHRDRQLQVIRNGLRNIQKLEPVAGPTDAAKPPPDPKVVGKIDRAGAGDSRALADLEAVGLSVLPALESRLALLGPDHAARAPLESLASKLSTRIGEVSIESDHWDIPDDLQKRAAEFKEKTLDFNKLVGLILSLAKAWGDNQPRVIEVVADRVSDGGGVSLTIVASPGGRASLKDASFRTSFHVTLGNDTLCNSSASTFGGKGDEESFNDLQRPVEKCLQAAHNVMFEVRIRCEFR